MVDIDLIRELVRLMSEHDLAEVRLRDGAEHVALRRRIPEAAPPPGPVYGPAAMPAPIETMALLPTNHTPQAPSPAVDEDAGLVAITSPMVGTYYSAASPQSPPFVAVGASVGPTSVVCIIEAMKVFNEIKAEVSGTVTKIMVANGQAVEYGQPLFKVRPSG